MKRKGLAIMVLAGVMALGGSFASFAGWEQTGTNWKYSQDGVYLTGWQWLDGDNDGISECYYLGNDGIMSANTVIEGYTVNEAGAWVVDGVVQTKQVVQETGNSVNNTATTQHPVSTQNGSSGINDIASAFSNMKPDETSAWWDAEAQKLAEEVGKAMCR